MTSRSLKQSAIVFGLAAIVLVAWISIASVQLRRLAPPPTVSTLRAFSDCMPEPTRLAIISDAGTTKIVWVGDVAFWALPSGPACYVFDAQGNLLDWDVQTGDGERTTRHLQPAYQSEPLTVQQAIDIISGG